MVTLRDAIKIAITADGAQAVSELHKVGDVASKELGKAEKGTRNWSATFAKAGALTGAGAVALGAGLYKAGQAASDLGEEISKTGVVFGDSAKDIEAYAESVADIGLSKTAALQAAGSFGVLFTGIGKSASEASEMSKRMVTLGADMASFSNASPEETLLAIQAALRGEAEPIRRFGVLLNDATLKQEALRQGLISTTKDALTPAQKAQAAYGVILAQTSKQQGDATRTSDSFANQQRRLKAATENLTASIGQAALPVMNTFADVALKVVGAFEAIPAPLQDVIGSAAVGATGLLALSSATSFAAAKFDVLRDAFKAITSSGPGGLGTLAALTVGAGVALGSLGGNIKVGTQAVKDLGVQSAKTGQSLKGLTREALAADLAMNKDVSRGLKATGTSLRDFITVVTGSEKGVKKYRDELVQLREEQFRIAQDTTHTAETERVVARDRAAAVGVMIKALDEQRGAYENNQRVRREVIKATEKEDKTNDAAAGSGKRHAAALKDVGHEGRKAADQLFRAQDATKKLHDAQHDALFASLDYEDAVAAVGTKSKDLADAIKEYGRNSPEAAQAFRDLQRATFDVNSTFEDGKDTILQNASALAGGATSGGRFRDELLKVRDTMAPSSPLRKWLDDYILALGKIPGNVSTDIIINARSNFRDQTGGGGHPGTGNTGLTPGKNPPKFHEGGLFRAPGGEGLAILRNGERVLTPEQAKGGNVFQITVNALDPQTAAVAVVDALKTYERTRGPVPIRTRVA